MAKKTFLLKADFAGSKAGPFDIKDSLGNVVATGITKEQIVAGYQVEIEENATSITLISTGECVEQFRVPLVFLPDCREEDADCLMTSLGGEAIINGFSSAEVCDQATASACTLGGVSITNLYPTEINDATCSLKSLAGTEILYGY
jgi:hypothetical protein